MTIKKKYFWYCIVACIVGVVAVNHNEKVTKSVLSQSLFGWLVSKRVSELGCMDMISVRVRMSVVVTAVMVMLLIRTTAKRGEQTNRTETTATNATPMAVIVVSSCGRDSGILFMYFTTAS